MAVDVKTPLKTSLATAPAARPRTWMALALIIATAVSILGVVGHEFLVFDDNHTIAGYADLNPPTVHSVMQNWKPSHANMMLYIPVTYTVWGACAKMAYLPDPDEHGWHLNPAIFHLTSAIVHLLNVWLLYLILLRLVKNDLAAVLGAGVFAMHPLQAESIAWASGLKDLLAGMFALLMLQEYFRYADETTSRSRRFGHFALAAACLLLGILSKPTAFVAPAMAGLIDWLILRRPLRKAISGPIVLLLIASPLIVIARSVQPLPAVIDLAMRPVVASFALAFYLFKLVWPVDLTMDYSWYPPRILAQPGLFVCLLVPITLLCLVLLTRKRIPGIAAGVLIFLIGVLPTLGFVPVGTQYFSVVADHYVYTAMLGVALAVAALCAWASRPALWLAVGLAVAGLGADMFVQMKNYQDNDAMFGHLISLNTHSVFAYLNYGQSLVERGNLLNTDADAAKDPKAPEVADDRRRAADFYRRGEDCFKAGIAARPGFAQIYKNYAELLIIEKRIPEAMSVIDGFMTAAARLGWGDGDVQVLMFLGNMLAEHDAAVEGQEILLRTIALRPQDTKPHRLLVAALLRQNRLDEAALEMDATLKLMREYPKPTDDSPGETCKEFGRKAFNVRAYSLAVREFEMAGQLGVADADTLQNMIALAESKLHQAATTSPGN